MAQHGYGIQCIWVHCGYMTTYNTAFCDATLQFEIVTQLHIFHIPKTHIILFVTV